MEGKKERLTSVLKKKQLESEVRVSVKTALEDIQSSFGLNEKVKYRFLAISNDPLYEGQLAKVLKDEYPSLRLVSVSPLAHVPTLEGSYDLCTFRMDNLKRHGTGTGRTY